MKHRDYQHLRHREHHPRVSIGIFFILLGICLLIATNDVFHLGSVSRYFTWETVLIFIGVLMFLNLQFTGGILFIAAGIWFLRDEFYFFSPDFFRIYYWPAIIGLIGISFILSSLIKRKN